MAGILRWRRSCTGSGRVSPIRQRSILAFVVLVLAACQSSSEKSTMTPIPSVSAPDRTPAPSTDGDDDDDGDDGEETSVFELETGDCFSADADVVESVTVVDCEDTHTYEVFGVFDHEADDDEPYPGDGAILEYADIRCQPLFEDYVAADYQTSIYWITSVTPSAETWDDGDDREIVCALKLGEEGEEKTGSAEGTGE
jgi:hypothetical protein